VIELTVESTGLNSHYDLTDRIAAALQEHGTGDGLAGVFAHGSCCLPCRLRCRRR
jgi:thiamine phosphate synthase YjbQ (UPF0047 family)